MGKSRQRKCFYAIAGTAYRETEAMKGRARWVGGFVYLFTATMLLRYRGLASWAFLSNFCAFFEKLLLYEVDASKDEGKHPCFSLRGSRFLSRGREVDIGVSRSFKSNRFRPFFSPFYIPSTGSTFYAVFDWPRAQIDLLVGHGAGRRPSTSKRVKQLSLKKPRSISQLPASYLDSQSHRLLLIFLLIASKDRKNKYIPKPMLPKSHHISPRAEAMCRKIIGSLFYLY